MRIIETNIPDIHEKNVDEAKLSLATEIIDKISPLFDEVHSGKVSQIEDAKIQLQKKRKQVSEDKNILESLVSSLNRQKALKKLILKINKLVSSGLVYDGNVKSETIVLLKILDNLTPDQIKHHDQRLTSFLAKRF